MIMGSPLTTHDRFTCMFNHQEADRIPITDKPWETTLERWRREGMPADVCFEDYFDIDHVVELWLDNSPRYEQKVLAETDTDITYTSNWGVTMRQWKHAQSTPQFLKHTIVDEASWRTAKGLITPTPDRINWEYLRENYPIWKAKGYWLQAGLWFGFDVTHAWVVGTERVLFALADNPFWLVDMFDHLLEINLTLWDMVWDAGYRFDSAFWWDDMGYKGHQFFSMKMYRNLLKPFHQRAIDWAHAKGIKSHLHSCGDINPFVPELVNMGLDALNPLEVKAGMDPLYLKKTYGKHLVLHGGINAVLWDQPEDIRAEIKRLIPSLKESGGYIFSSDHSVPDNVSLENFRQIVDLAKQMGTYQA